MGGSQAILARAKEDFAKGEYRWVAQVLDHVVFAEPDNREARELEADALEQLGYQAESGPWRNAYLTGAKELRSGTPKLMAAQKSGNRQAQSLPPALYFANLGIRLDGLRAQGKNLSLHIALNDLGQNWLLELRNAVLHASQVKGTNAKLSLSGTMADVTALFEGHLSLEEARKRGMLTGDAVPLEQLLSLLDTFSPDFAIIEP